MNDCPPLLLEGTLIRLHLPRKTTFVIHVRIPNWLKKEAIIQLNGRALDTHGTAGSFLAIERAWSDGDKLEVLLPKSLRFEAIDAQTPERAALMYGPLLLAALSEKDVELRGDIKNPETWIKRPSGTDTDFLTQDIHLQTIVFRPLYIIQDEHSTTYSKITAVP